jgi:serine/threonine-protein kinase
MIGDLRALLERSLGDGYRFERVLEGGGAAKVFVVYDAARGQDIVVKVLSPELSSGVDRERFRREIHVATLLQHPRVVPVLATGDAGDALYFTMPYIDGASLRELITKEGQLSLARALDLTRDVAEALEYAHSRNIVHRDIKPDNILVERTSGRALVTDFGIARAIERAADIVSVTSTGLTLGTPTYMSPEQASAEKHIDGRSDIYSLGCVLYELLAGSPPFTGVNARTVIARHLSEPPPSISVVRPDVPEAVQEMIGRMLAKAPAARFGSARELIAALDSARAPTPRATNAPHAPSHRSPGSRWVRVAIGAVAVGAIAGAAFVANHRPSSPPLAKVTDPKRIAVLYLDSPESDTALATIGRGLTRDLIFALGRVPGLQLITENGVRRFGAHATPDSVARALNVGTVIVGTIDRVNDSLQLDLRLVDVNTLVEKAAIRGRYAPSMLLTMRDSAVREVSRDLLRSIGKEVQAYAWRSETQSAAAWSFVQRAHDVEALAEDLPSQPSDFGPQLHLLGTAQSLLDSAERADTKWEEPTIERGWVELRRVQLYSTAQLRPLLDSLSGLVRLASVRWPGSTRVLELRGAVEFERLKNGFETSTALLDSAETDLRAATAIDRQRARAWLILSSVLNRKGDSTGSILATRNALEADGYGREVPRTMVTLVFRYLYGRQNDSARTYCAFARSRFPNDAYVQSCELSVLGWTGTGAADVAAMWKALDRTERAGAFPLEGGVFPVGRYWLAAVIGRSGLADSARTVLANTGRQLHAIGHDGAYPMHEAQVRLILGEPGRALALLDSAIRRDPAKRQMIAALPWFDALHTAPRFQELTAPRTPAR